MKIAILSDIHDHVRHLEAALRDIALHNAEMLICCGDLCSPFILTQLQETFHGPIHLVFGNNDGDTHRITHLASSHVKFHPEMAEIRIGDVLIAVNHYPQIARPLALSGRYDLVCYGHNHEPSAEVIGHTLLLNPGSIMGYQPSKRKFVTPTFGMYSTITREYGIYEVKP